MRLSPVNSAIPDFHKEGFKTKTAAEAAVSR
jgi:hypothetical protein